MIEFQIEENDWNYGINLAQSFTDYVIDTNKHQYAKRGQYNIERIKNQILDGKMTEFGYMMAAYPKCNYQMSFEIFEGKNKSHDEDLIDLDMKYPNVQVKCASHYGGERSWVFQDTAINKYNKNYPKEIFALCDLDKIKKIVYIIALMYWSDICILLKDCKNDNVRSNKKAIYESDISKSFQISRQ